jgi:ATP-dependent Clp protease ATP-binding subunit ClpA
VLLLDEIEKAHPDIFQVLLQVMDHGTLTDNNGKKSDFRHIVLIMTSNVGARELTRRASASASGRRGRRRQGLQEHCSAPSSATASTRASASRPLDPVP